MTEQTVIEQLRGYKRIVARIKLLEKHSIGNGMYLQALKGDDKLQALHRQLRGLPSYMYLNQRELQLESVAHAYLTRYPAGTRAQLREVRQLHGADPEDEKLLKELQQKIKRVIEARAGIIDDYEAVIERISELQDLEEQKARIDNALEALEEYKSEYAELLRIHFIDGKPWYDAAKAMNVSKDVFYRWRKRAIAEYELIAN